MRILDEEIKLRDATREAEQLRLGKDSGEDGKSETQEEGEHQRTLAAQYAERAEELAERQEKLEKRTRDVVTAISKLPRSLEFFTKEMQLLTRVAEVMSEATEILSEPETGARAIAAETEAIELLLQSKRMMGSGGGGGDNPGGGGGGTTAVSALALIGKGTNPKGGVEARGVHQQAGKAGRRLPAEFRRGLDRFLSLPLGGGSRP